MSDTVINVEKLSKAYLLGQKEKQDTLFGSIVAAVKSPLTNLRQLHRLNTFHLSKEQEESEDILWALRDVSFEVKRGEVLGIIGRNGAGKSTLLKILSRIADPTRGRAEIRGRVSALLEVGTGFHPELSGRENVYLNGTILGMKKAEIDAKFDEIVDFSGVERFLDTPVKRYSSGMKVRLAFAVAAHLEPEILIIDEVLAVGDAEFQKKCLGKMQEVSTGEGRTVLFVSHNMGAVSHLCTRVVRLADGIVTGDASPDIMIRQHLEIDSRSGELDATNYSAERTGSGPIRFVRVAFRNSQGDVCSQIRWNDSWGIELVLHSDEPTQVNIAIGIRDQNGRMVLNFHDRDDGVTNSLAKGTNCLIIWPQCNLLNSGDYYISAQIDDKFGQLNDRIGNCLRFSVDDTPSGNVRCQGIFKVPCKWETL